MRLLRGHTLSVATILRVGDRATVLAVLRSGDRLVELDLEGSTIGWVLVFHPPRRIDPTAGFGMPVAARGAGWTTLEDGPEPREGILVAAGGRVRCAHLGRELSPAEWVDLEGLSIEALEPLADPPKPLARTEPLPVRAVFGRPLDPKAAALRDALAETRAPHSISGFVALRVAGALAGLAGGLLGRTARGGPLRPDHPSWLGSLLAWLRGTRGGSATGEPLLAAPRATPGWLESLIDWARSALARTLLGSWLGHEHAKALERLQRALRDGDSEEALRWAIPLEDSPSSRPRAPRLARPTARTSFEIALARRPSFGSLGLESDVFSDLRSEYRALAQRLVSEGRIDEAAFVHAELLGDVLEAVRLLEKSNPRRAAELAELRELDPARAVKLWMLAGDLARAVRVARRTASYGAAIRLLENQHAHLAEALALTWADIRASSGDYLGAIEALASKGVLAPRFVPLARRFAELGLARSGGQHSELLVWALELADEASLHARIRDAEQLLRSDTDARSPHLTALLATRGPGHRPELAPLVRLAHRVQLAHPERAPRVQRVGGVVRGFDPVFMVDAPAPVSVDRMSLHERSDTLTLGLGRPGRVRIHDASVLPDGRWVLALGALGATVCDREGVVLAAFPQATDAVVVSDSYRRALFVERGRGVTRVLRVDLEQLVSGDPFSLAGPHAHTATFDGECWGVIDRERAEGHILDVTERTPISLWSTSRDLPVHEVTRRAAMPSAIAFVGREAVALARSSGRLAQVRAKAAGELVDPMAMERRVRAVEAGFELHDGTHAIPLDVEPMVLEKSDAGLSVLLASDGTVRVLAQHEVLRVAARGFRLQGIEGRSLLVVWDDEGRAAAIDLGSGCIVASTTT